MLTVEQAERELEIASAMTSGLWVEHSRTAAHAARVIAERCGMDGNKAYVFGLLHDIGRRKGSWGVEHVFDGYEYMTNIGEPQIARICLTHSYPRFDGLSEYIEMLKCTPKQREFLNSYLANTEYDDYDSLIQLCDNISLPIGVCVMEKRFIDVALRHGVNSYTVARWREYIRIKNYFDEKCGCNIYTLFPDIVKNSFDNI